MRLFRKKRSIKQKPLSTTVGLNQVFAKLSYKKNNERSSELAKYNANYKYDPQLSTREHAVFYNPTQHKSVIAYRGTALSDKRRWHKDLLSDTLIATGLQGLDPRHRRSVRAYDRIKKALPDYDVSVTGHSLGGSIANHVANNRKSVRSAIAFSRGAGPVDVLKKKSNKVLDASNRADPISMFARLQNSMQGKHQITTDPKKGTGLAGMLNHSLEQTTKLEFKTPGYEKHEFHVA